MSVFKKRPVYLGTGADPVPIDPGTIIHSILVAEVDKTDISGVDATVVVDELQALLNPEFWTSVARLGDPGIVSGRRHLALVNDPVTPDALLAVLDKLEVPDEASAFVRLPTVSLDGGQTSQVVASVLVFREDTPRLVIAEQEPVLKRRT